MCGRDGCFPQDPFTSWVHQPQLNEKCLKVQEVTTPSPTSVLQPRADRGALCLKAREQLGRVLFRSPRRTWPARPEHVLRAGPCVTPSSAPPCSLHSFQEHLPAKSPARESPSQVLLLVNPTAGNTLYNTLGTDGHWKVMAFTPERGEATQGDTQHANKSCFDPRGNFSNCSL